MSLPDCWLRCRQMAELHYPGGTSSQEGRHQHVYPVWQEDRHETSGLECPCDPEFMVECVLCGGRGCETCDDGWIPGAKPPPDVPCVIVHNILPEPKVENHVSFCKVDEDTYGTTPSTDPDVDLLGPDPRTRKPA